jgi:hypothetical protein
MIEKPHRAIALTDGWLCIKYLEGGEESLTTFADISKGDVITYTHAKDVQSERDKVLDEFLHLLDIRCDYIRDIKLSSNEIYKMANGLREKVKNDDASER